MMMERHDDDDLTTADLAGTTRATGGESEHHKAAPDNLPASADTVEPERPEQTDEDAETEAARPSRDPSPAAAGEHEPETDQERSPLLPQGEAAEFQGRWEALQTSFVDEPRRAVQEGDTLVAELMQRLANSFAEERQSLEAQWDRGDDVSTEDLRIALQRYRSFFDRLLST
jgi:hypothetical protein